MTGAIDLFGESPAARGNDRNSGYEREADDWYVEPPRAWHALLNVERFDGVVWDPSCGLGTGPKVLAARGHVTAASDLIDRGYPDAISRDFYRCGDLAANIVTNPPYDELDRYIATALRLARHKVAMLLPLARLEGQKRGRMFQSTPFARLHVFSGRIACPPGRLAKNMSDAARDAEQGFVAYAWFVWDKAHAGDPTVHFLP